MKSVRFCNLLTQQASIGKKIQSQVLVEISCCYKINYCWWFKALSEISKSQTGVFVWNKFRIEEFVDLELRVITWVSTTRGSIRFRVKSIVNTSILFSEFVPCGLFRSNPPQVFLPWNWTISLVFLDHHIVMFFTFLVFMIWLIDV